ncbi:hypothetical protein JF544_05630 [Halobacillus kuroshimensis]|uniref:Uncharacterized protein n=1 Tax=Halobacillus kuroshimensis TaxID=302481 RepID=A0ABS3DTM9_9BACI|nr:hypothetical protein [Halobacillus kuroshimensis]MBN8234718.1 hypothetical protein [Halobacillus kuroshimensis]
MLHLDYKEAHPEQKKKMIQDILEIYDSRDTAQMVQALGHSQALLGSTQKEFAQALGKTERTIRSWKSNNEDAYIMAFEKYQPTAPELPEDAGNLDEEALESTYNNLMSRLKDKRTTTKDLAQILEYFGISGKELQFYAKNRGKSLRGFYRDGEAQLIHDEFARELFKHIIAESELLYRGTEKSLGNTQNYLNADLSDPIVRLEHQVMGGLFMGLWNGYISPQTIEMAKVLRILKLAEGSGFVSKTSTSEFNKMDGKKEKVREMKDDARRELVMSFGKEEGMEMFNMLKELNEKAVKETVIKMPKYEDVEQDYKVLLERSQEKKDLATLLAEIDNFGKREKIVDKYKKYIQEDE